MPYCQNCGSQIPAGTRFCANCGSAVTNQANTNPINQSYRAVSQDAAAIRNKQKKNNKTAIIIVAVVLVIVIIGVLGNKNDTNNGNDTTKTASASNTTSTPKPTATPRSTATPKPKTEFGVGERAELNNIVCTLVSVTENYGSTYNRPTEGNVFVLCEFEIENNTNSEIAISSLMSFEAYCDDYACNFSLTALIEKGNKNQLDGQVAAGKKFNGVVGYEIPSDWQELELHFTPDFWRGKEFVFVANHNE